MRSTLSSTSTSTHKKIPDHPWDGWPGKFLRGGFACGDVPCDFRVTHVFREQLPLVLGCAFRALVQHGHIARDFVTVVERVQQRPQSPLFGDYNLFDGQVQQLLFGDVGEIHHMHQHTIYVVTGPCGFRHFALNGIIQLHCRCSFPVVLWFTLRQHQRGESHPTLAPDALMSHVGRGMSGSSPLSRHRAPRYVTRLYVGRSTCDVHPHNVQWACHVQGTCNPHLRAFGPNCSNKYVAPSRECCTCGPPVNVMPTSQVLIMIVTIIINVGNPPLPHPLSLSDSLQKLTSFLECTMLCIVTSSQAQCVQNLNAATPLR